MPNIGGLHHEIKATGLIERINLINQALDLYHQAQRLLEQANQISVEVSMEDGSEHYGARGGET